MAVRWGILSTAGINDAILKGAAASDIADVVAVASRDGEHAARYAAEQGIARSHGSYDALLHDDQVDAVYISLPNSMHADWSIRALAAGKHVLCEKPLTRHSGDVVRAFDAAKAANRLLMEGLMYRHHPQTALTRSLVADGAIGKVQFIRAALSFPLADQGNIRLSRDLEGGAIMDLGCYCISSMRLIAGEPHTVLGAQVTTADGVDTRFFGTLLFADDVVGQFDVAMTMPGRGQLEIVGSGGSIVVDDPWVIAKPGITIRRPGIEHIDVAPVDHYRLELENFSRAILGQEAPLLGFEDALGQARAIEALYAAAAAGRTQNIEGLSS